VFQAITPLLLLLVLLGGCYRSEEPLFAFREGTQPLTEGQYVDDFDDTLSFTRDGDHYRVSDQDSSATVALIPVDGSADLYLFQQSAGDHDAFYGMLRVTPDQPGFALLVADCSKPSDRKIAEMVGALPKSFGKLVVCSFDSRDGVIAALTVLAHKAPADDWQIYRPL
jgi:hypothetical protein